MGLPALRSPLDQYNRATRVLIMTSPHFDFPARPLPSNTRYTGIPFEPTLETHWDMPWPSDDQRPLVLVSFSTSPQGQAEYLKRTIEALAALPVRSLVTLGPTLKVEDFESHENVALVNFVPHGLVLPSAAAMVSQCGHGTVMKALAHGVPLVCLPLIGDQPDIAARVVHAGAGIRLPRSASPQDISKAIQRILSDPSYLANARRLGKKISSEDGAKSVADELELIAYGTGN
ncbi:MAG: glycosyltransferase [Dehalococcoidia bacterium]